MKRKQVAEGIVRRVNDDGTPGGFYERVRIGGRDTFRKLAGSTLAEARTIRAKHLVQYAQWKNGENVRNPYEAEGIRHVDGLGALVRAYVAAGCPGRKKRDRSPRCAQQARSCLERLLTWPGWSNQSIDRINVTTLQKYNAWRSDSDNMVNGRSVDLEVLYFGAMLRWAASQRLIPRNPLAGEERPVFQTATPRKCRECRPDDANELHATARKFFAQPNSEVTGWQYLYEALTGARTSEALRNRWDAVVGQPGHIDGSILYLHRAKNGLHPWREISPVLREFLTALKAWRDRRYPSSPWWFPSPHDPDKSVSATSLVHALARITPEGVSRTSHGLRAYYVTARRSEMVDDRIIADEIGDKSGAAIIVSTYGSVPPNWRDTTAGKVGWLPTDGSIPAWQI